MSQKSEVFNVTQTNFFNIAKSTKFLDVTNIKFHNVAETDRSGHRRCSVKKGVLRNFAKFTGKHLCQRLFFNKVAGQVCNFIKKESLAQVFSCEFCKISKNVFFYRTPPDDCSWTEVLNTAETKYLISQKTYDTQYRWSSCHVSNT